MVAARGEEERRVELLHQADRASLAAAGLGENNDARTAAQRCAFLPAAASTPPPAATRDAATATDLVKPSTGLVVVRGWGSEMQCEVEADLSRLRV